MSEKNTKQVAKRKNRSETAKVIADIAGCTPTNVRQVMNGDHDNEKILTATILYEQGKNELIKEIKKLVPFE